MTYGEPTAPPDEADCSSLAAEFEGRTLSDRPRGIKEIACRRCERKQHFLRRYTDATRADLRSTVLSVGDSIKFVAVYTPNEDGFYLPDGPFWQVSCYYHTEHEHAPPEASVPADSPFVLGEASLVPVESAPAVDIHPDHSAREGEAVLTDVSIKWYAPPGVGFSESEKNRLQRGGEPVVAKAPEKPRPWPEEDYQWLKGLIEQAVNDTENDDE